MRGGIVLTQRHRFSAFLLAQGPNRDPAEAGPRQTGPWMSLQLMLSFRSLVPLVRLVLHGIGLRITRFADCRGL